MGKPDYEITELRFGNLLLFNGHTVDKVSELSGIEMTVNGLSALDDDMYDVIPITGSWLSKLGFIDPFGVGKAFRIDISDLVELCWYKQDGELRLQTKDAGWTRLLPTKYIHQVQNLYFSLTGKELTYEQ